MFWTFNGGEEQLPELAARIVADLTTLGAPEPFCLWLKGDLGAGKTTLAGFILQGLGLDQRIPVTSPTYTYINEYQIKDKWFAHLDLYRASAHFNLDDLGLVGYRIFSGYLVEWPEQIPADAALAPTHVLDIEFASPGARVYRFSSR